jgi:hypothetical protein
MMNIKVLTILAVVISTIYIYYTVQKDKDGLYETLSIASDKISEHIIEEPTIKTIVKTIPIAEPVIEKVVLEEKVSISKQVVEPSIEVVEKIEIEEPIIKKVVLEEKVSISKQEIYVKEDINYEESLESTIAAALKGIITYKIIKTEENK